MITALKMRRIQLGLKQKDVAEQVGITSQYLRNLESGKANNPSIKVMKNISSILNCSVEELFFQKFDLVE